MRWPWIHVAHLDAALALLTVTGRDLQDERARYDALLEKYISMKQQGFAPVPQRTPTLPNVPYRGGDLATREKFVKQFSEEPGVTPELAQLAADQLMAELQ